MSDSATQGHDVVVIGAGPAGVIAALRAGRLGARTALIARDEFGGMAANDGPVPVRTLAHAARLMREARQLPRYGITAGEASLDYRMLLERVDEVTRDVRTHSLLRADLEQAGVAIHEHAGTARFLDEHTVAGEYGPRLRSRSFIICTGGASRRLPIPGFELTATHSDAWGLSAAPRSMLVVGAGATGIQVASIFNAFGSRVHVLEVAPRILMSEDHQVSATVAAALRGSGVDVVADAGTIARFERCPAGVRAVYGNDQRIDAEVAVVAIGWVADTAELKSASAGVETDLRGYIKVDAQFRTTAGHIFAAGDVTGRALVVHEAVREAYVAATNAATGAAATLPEQVSPLGSFTDPEYASVGLTEHEARAAGDPVVVRVPFELLARAIIDDRRVGFCKLIVDRPSHSILGCHIVGERAVELAQLAATAMAANMTVEQLAAVPFSFPTYADALGRAAIEAARELDPTGSWAFDHLLGGPGTRDEPARGTEA